MSGPWEKFNKSEGDGPWAKFSQEKPEDDEQKKLNKQVSGLGDKLGGLAETGAMIGTGAVAQVAGLVPAALQTINNWGQGKEGNFGENYFGAMDAMTYSPKHTESGPEMGQATGDFFNRYVVPIAPMHLGSIGGAFSIASRGLKERIPVPKQTKADAMIAAREADPPKPTAEPADRPTMQVTPEGQAIVDPRDAMFKAEAERRAALVEAARPAPDRNLADPFGQMKQQLGVDQRLPAEPNPAIGRMVDDLQNPPMNAEVLNKADAAQAAIEARRKAMEQEVAQRGGLDFNAAERARQEAAPTGYADHLRGQVGERAMGATADGLLSPAERMQRQLAREQVPTKGTDTMFVDPAGQVLRQAPDDMAMMALERQKEAARNNLEHGIATKRGQPMDLLTRDSLMESNNGPQARPQDIIDTGLREALGGGTMNHPMVKKAMERVTKAEELYIKAAEQAREGKVTRSQLARIERDLQDLRASAERTVANIAGGRSRMGGVGKRQGGAIDPDVFLKMFPEFMNSKFKDANGQLKKFYHGTSKDKHFDDIKADGKRGGWFTENPKTASEYARENDSKGLKYEHGKYHEVNSADRVHEVYLNIQKPYKISQADIDAMNRTPNYAKAQRELFEKIRAQGYDGVDWGHGVAVAFDSKQIKSAISPENKTKFPKGQKGAVNPEVFKEGFQKLKQLADGTWLRAHSDGNSLTIEAIKDSHKLGGALFEKTDKYDQPSNVNMAATMVGSKQKGMATEIYKFASELGNDIQPSKIRTKEGSAMWDRFEQKGLAKNEGGIRYIPKGQRGAIFLNPKQHDKLKDVGAIEKILGPIAPSKMTAEDAVSIAKTAPDMEQNLIQKGLNYFTKGGLYQAIKTKNPVVRFGVEKITEADRLSRADIQHYVHDKLAPAFREMSNAEQRDVWKIINHADKTQKAFTREEMIAGGFSEKQIAAVETHREVMDRAFESMNNVRKQLGMDPVNRREAYAAMNASGDYRMVVKKDGEIVGMIGRNDKYSANVLAERLKNEGYEIGEQHYIGSVPHERGSAQTALLQALDFLAKEDPRLKELLLKADEVMKDEAYGFMNMKKHTLEKKGVFGMQGRKNDLLWDFKKQERLNDLNAKEGLQAQVAYAEMALKWEHMTNAAVQIKDVLKSPELVDKQHFAKKWVEEHLQNALGYNPDALGRSLENALSQAFEKSGVGYSHGRTAIAASRKIVNTALLGLSPGFWTSNVLQPLVSMPAMKASLVAKGLDANFDFGTGYSYMGQGTITALKQQLEGKMGIKLNAFEQDMKAYAKKYHVYGSDLIEHSNRVRKDGVYRVEQVGNFVAGNIESSTRRTMFFTFAHMLKDNGMTVKNGLFEAAHNLTDMTMNNYSATERPRIYNTMGPVGDVSANLASFKHNEVSRLAMFARQIGEDKTAKPLLISLASQVAFAGIKGVIAFEEADQIYKMITKMMGKPDSLSLRVMKLSEAAGKKVNEFTGAQKTKMGDASHVLSHGGFSAIGLDLSKRLGIGDAIADNLGDAMFPGGSKLVDMAGAAANAIGDPSELNLKRAAREFSPAALTGAEDLTWFSKENGNLPVNRRTLEAQPRRTQADKVWKAAGLTGVNESVQKGKHYEVEWIKDAYTDMRKSVLERAHGELFTKGGVSEKTIRDYLAREGDIDTLARDMERTLKKQSIPAKDRDLLRSAMSRSITSLRHAQRLQEAFKE